jgi:hypothetical protein
VASPCPHLETASALLHDRPALMRPPSRRHGLRRGRGFRAAAAQRISKTRTSKTRLSKKPSTARAAPVDETPGDLLRIIAVSSSRTVSVVAQPGFVRLQSTAADPKIPRADDRRAAHLRPIAAHAFQRASREQIEIIDVDSRARDLVQLFPGYLTG